MISIKKKLSIILMLFITVAIAGCDSNKNNDLDGKATFKVRMTDAPAAYDEVNVDIQGVEIHSDATGWQPLVVNAGIYNLLDYVNGADTLIASDDLPAGTVSQIRLLLGPNNTVVVNGQSYPLETPSAQQSGLKLQVHKILEPGITYIVVLDFDANMSVVETGSGKYILKPVIKVLTEGIDGVIVGSVDPIAANPAIYAIKGTDTTSTIPDGAGNFMIQGLEGGTYDVLFVPVVPYNDTTVANVGVTVGNITDIGVINISQ